MDSIQPIHGIGEEPLYTPPLAKTEALTPAPTTAESLKIDAARLQREPAYAIQVLDWMLYRARTAYNDFRYQDAQESYEQYFRYLKYYRGNSYYSAPVNFVPALFEKMWTMEIQGEVKEAQRFLNLELVKLLTPVAQTEAKQPQAVRDKVAELTAQGLLPSPQHLQVEVEPKTLNQLAQVAQENQAPVLASRLLGFSQVTSYREAYRAQRQGAEIDHAQSGAVTPYRDLPFGYAHFGTPIAPVYMQPPDMAQRLASQSLVDPHHVDRIEPIYALNKDPEEEDKRRRRQKRLDWMRDRLKKNRTKPPMTL